MDLDVVEVGDREDEVGGKDLVRERVRDLWDGERNVDRWCVVEVEIVEKNRVRGLGREVKVDGRLGSGRDLGSEDEVEVGELGGVVGRGDRGKDLLVEDYVGKVLKIVVVEGFGKRLVERVGVGVMVE